MTTIKCPHCAGKGRVEPEKALSPALAKALASVPKSLPCTAGWVAGALKISRNSARNRLLALFRLGLVRRQKTETQGIHAYSRVIRERKQA